MALFGFAAARCVRAEQLDIQIDARRMRAPITHPVFSCASTYLLCAGIYTTILLSFH